MKLPPFRRTVHLDALNRYKGTKAHFVDCLIAAVAVAKNVPVSSFDQDFRRFVGAGKLNSGARVVSVTAGCQKIDV